MITLILVLPINLAQFQMLGMEKDDNHLIRLS
jgi:hypothetical protein